MTLPSFVPVTVIIDDLNADLDAALDGANPNDGYARVTYQIGLLPDSELYQVAASFSGFSAGVTTGGTSTVGMRVIVPDVGGDPNASDSVDYVVAELSPLAHWVRHRPYFFESVSGVPDFMAPVLLEVRGFAEIGKTGKVWSAVGSVMVTLMMADTITPKGGSDAGSVSTADAVREGVEPGFPSSAVVSESRPVAPALHGVRWQPA